MPESLTDYTLIKRLNKKYMNVTGTRFQTARLSKRFLMCPIARVGLSPFGQTETQFMIPLQRKTLKGSSKSESLSSVAVSLLSAINLYACNNPEGPMNLSGFHQKEGQAVEQQAHRIHSYKPSSFSRSWGDWRRSISGGSSSFIKYGFIFSQLL